MFIIMLYWLTCVFIMGLDLYVCSGCDDAHTEYVSYLSCSDCGGRFCDRSTGMENKEMTEEEEENWVCEDCKANALGIVICNGKCDKCCKK